MCEIRVHYLGKQVFTEDGTYTETIVVDQHLVHEIQHASGLLEQAIYDLAGEIDASRIGTLVRTAASLAALSQQMEKAIVRD